MTTNTDPVRALAELAERAVPFLRDEAAKYDDDGSNEPLELAREIETALASLPSDESALSSASSAFDGSREAAPCPHARGVDCDCANPPVLASAPPNAMVGVEVGASLWCLHILGPDDVIPAPSRLYAELAAHKLNEWYARQPKGEHCPHMEAVAAPWPHDAKSHADDVETFIERWILPSGQVQAAARALTQQPAAPSGEAVGAWVTVPREPTDAMLDAMHGRIRILCNPAERTADIQNDAEVWGAMLAAAPQQPAGVDEICEWSQQDLRSDFVSTGCGHEFILTDASEHNDGASVFPFCCYCAKPMVLRHWRDEHSEEALAAQQQGGRADG